jgi:hypothetical protein
VAKRRTILLSIFEREMKYRTKDEDRAKVMRPETPHPTQQQTK